MRLLKQSSTAQPLMFLMVSSTDHITGVTGLSPTVTLSKNGGSFASPAGAVSEVANGWYKVAGNATDTETLGPLVLHATGTGADPVDVEFGVVVFDPQDTVRLGLTALPNAAADAAGGLPISDDGGLDMDAILDNLATLLTRLSSARAGYLDNIDNAALQTTAAQTGDSYARLGAPAGASVSADLLTLLGRLTSTRAGYLDNLTNLDAPITGLNNLSALINIYGSPLLEIPDSSSTDYAFTVVVRDNEGKLVDLDASPTIAAANAAGTDRSGNLSSVSNPSTGRYTFTYNVDAADTAESLRITVSGAVSSEARYIEWIGAVVDYDTVAALVAIQNDLDILTGTDGVTLASSQPNYAPALVGSEMTLANGAIQTAKIADGTFTAAKFGSGAFDAVWSVATRTLTSVSGLGVATAAKLLAYVQLILRSDAAIATDNAAELTEINADGGSGAGDFANTADANEAIRDRGDAAWITATGFSTFDHTTDTVLPADGSISADTFATDAIDANALAADAVAEINASGNPLVLQSTTIATLASQLSFTLTAGSADDDAYNGCLAIVTDASTATQKAVGVVLQYVGSSRTVRLAFDPGVFTMAAGDALSIMAANETPIIHAEMSVKSTAGNDAQLTAWMEVAGTRVPVASIDAAATCGFVVREHNSGTNLFSASGVAADLTNSMFEIEQASPGFTDDRQYELTATITLNSVPYSTTHSRVVIG